jgi:phenylpropionate dioxygenase-like ring-hydroxylating dioxygenase large terminal subunit
MLSQEDNQLLTRVGPGTPMGDLFRRFWIPVLLAEEVPQPDGDPVRVRILGEDLIAFKDTNGQVGLIQNNCPHRGASLFFGRNEQGGLRCVYHGWKFATDGTCVDMPNEPAESDFLMRESGIAAYSHEKSKVKALAYPTLQRGGLVWAYMGPPERQPAPPDLEFTQIPDSHRAALPRPGAVN